MNMVKLKLKPGRYGLMQRSGRLYKLPEQAFAARVDKAGPNGCWIWQGCKNKQGYGQLKVNGKHMRAHRFSWQLHNGTIPKGEGYHGTCVLHKCDNPSCVNPDHLFLGTPADNNADMVSKGRCKVPGFKGEMHGQSKLTERDVIAIRHDQKTQRKVAANYGVCQSTVSRIKIGEIWGHVT